MVENNEISVAYATNLPPLNIKSQLNINIDSNTNVKQILNIETCLIEAQVEPMANKALVKGMLGLKVVYIDMDNMFNTVSDTVNFSETLNSELISTNSKININNSHFIADGDADSKMIRVNIDGYVELFCNINNNLGGFNALNDSLITKKATMSADCHVQTINKEISYNDDFKLDLKINKILSYDSKIVVEDSKCYNGYVLINGQIINTIICEIENDNGNYIKIYNNSSNLKCEIEASDCDADCVADLSAYVNLNSTQITTDISETYTKLSFEYCIIANGSVYKTTNFNVIEDVYSVESFVEPSRNNYKLCKKSPYLKVNENVDTEIILADELSIDEILGMVNTSSSVVKYTINNDSLNVEGVISGNLLYFDENREIKHLPTQLPYSISVKHDLQDEICGMHFNMIPVSCKCKIKRGNTLMVDCELCVTGNIYTQKNIELIDNVKYGTALNYGDVAFQVYIAKPNETSWDLCKRLHITPEQLADSNKDCPATYIGGEKILVYR